MTAMPWPVRSWLSDRPPACPDAGPQSITGLRPPFCNIGAPNFVFFRRIWLTLQVKSPISVPVRAQRCENSGNVALGGRAAADGPSRVALDSARHLRRAELRRAGGRTGRVAAPGHHRVDRPRADRALFAGARLRLLRRGSSARHALLRGGVSTPASRPSDCSAAGSN